MFGEFPRSTPAPTRSSATTCRGAAATAWSTATARSSPTATSLRGNVARRARHGLARVLPRLERRADPAAVARAVQLRGSEHLRRAVARRRLHAVLRPADHGARRPERRRSDAAEPGATTALSIASTPRAAVPLGGRDEPAGAVHRRGQRRSTRPTSPTPSSPTTPTARRSRWRSICSCASARTAGSRSTTTCARCGACTASRAAEPGSSRSPTRWRTRATRLAEVSGDRAFADDFFDRYVEGREVPDYARCWRGPAWWCASGIPGAAWTGVVDRRVRQTSWRRAAWWTWGYAGLRRRPRARRRPDVARREAVRGRRAEESEAR